jgi:hypothetical protein
LNEIKWIKKRRMREKEYDQSRNYERREKHGE